MNYEEKTMPGLIDIEDNHSILIKEYAAKSRCNIANIRGVCVKSWDVDELNTT